MTSSSMFKYPIQAGSAQQIFLSMSFSKPL